MTRIQAKAARAARPVKQNYNKSGKLEARRDKRRNDAIARQVTFEMLTPEAQWNSSRKADGTLSRRAERRSLFVPRA